MKVILDMHELAFTIGGSTITAPASVPQGGISYAEIVIKNAAALLLVAAVLFSIIFIVLAGFQWATSGGDKAKLAGARSRLTWAIGGLVIAFLAFAIVSFIGFFFNVPLI